VVLDGKSRGRLKQGTPFMIEDLEPRKYRVALKNDAVLPVVKTVTLRPGQVKVLNLPLPVPAAKAHLVLVVKPLETRVLLDGAEVSKGALKEPLELTAGQVHEVRVEKEGFTPQVLKVTLTPGEKAERSITLSPAPPRLTVKSRPPGGRVFIDGERKGTTPVTIEDLRPGRHRVKVMLDDHKAQSQWVEVEMGKAVEVPFFLKPEQPEAPEPGATDGPETPETPETPDKPDKPDKPERHVAKKPKPERHAAKKPERHVARKPRAKKPRAKKPGKPAKPSKPSKQDKPDKPDKPAGDVGYLVTNTIPWAKVLVDGKDTGKTTPVAPRSKIPLKPGRHKITFVVEGKKFDYTITIRAGEITRLIKRLKVD